MKIAPGGWFYAGLLFAAAIPAFFISPAIGIAAIVLAVAVLVFHRDPERTAPPTGVVSPADGKVSVIRDEDERLRLGVFMNVHDVHVNRAPLSGTVASVEHKPGAYKPAFSKDSDRNERVRIDCGTHEIILIAGWFARRIHPYVEAGDELERGDRIGHISFGSRADVLLPESVSRADLEVTRGDRVTAGETVLARE